MAALIDAIPGLSERMLGAGTSRQDEDVGAPRPCLGEAALDRRQRKAGGQGVEAAPDLPGDGGLEVLAEVLVIERVSKKAYSTGSPESSTGTVVISGSSTVRSQTSGPAAGAAAASRSLVQLAKRRRET